MVWGFRSLNTGFKHLREGLLVGGVVGYHRTLCPEGVYERC